MATTRRLIETPVCRRYVQIACRDFLMSERELAAKYRVPWHPAWLAPKALLVGAVLAGVCAGLLGRVA